MFNKDAAFKINITVTITVTPDTPTAKPASRLIDRVAHDVTDSKVISRVMYDAAARKLYITFLASGKTYEYSRVEFYVFQELMAAESKGTYFGLYIRNSYTTREITR